MQNRNKEVFIMMRQRFNTALLFVLLLTLVAACSKGGNSSSEPPTNASPVGTWVGSYLSGSTINSIKLIFKADMSGNSWLNGTRSTVADFSYLVSGSNLTWNETEAFFTCTYQPCPTCVIGLYAANAASGTISRTTMTVTFSRSSPCTAGGTVTVTKQ